MLQDGVAQLRGPRVGSDAHFFSWTWAVGNPHSLRISFSHGSSFWKFVPAEHRHLPSLGQLVQRRPWRVDRGLHWLQFVQRLLHVGGGEVFEEQHRGGGVVGALANSLQLGQAHGTGSSRPISRESGDFFRARKPEW
jgi:hypothetical protein